MAAHILATEAGIGVAHSTNSALVGRIVRVLVACATAFHGANDAVDAYRKALAAGLGYDEAVRRSYDAVASASRH